MKLRMTDQEYEGLNVLARIINQTQGLIRNKRVKHENGQYVISSSNCDPLLFAKLNSVLEMLRNQKALMVDRISG